MVRIYLGAYLLGILIIILRSELYHCVSEIILPVCTLRGCHHLILLGFLPSLKIHSL